MKQFLDLASTPPVPWKNGGGSTRELACWPPGAGMDSFAWRVSVATIARPGPFSAFPGVDRQIMLLEDELGEPLFIRAKRGVKLSPAGQAALEHAVRLLDEAEALRERVSGGEHSPAGRVRAAAATQAIVHLFAPLFEAFMRAQPRIDVSFRTMRLAGHETLPATMTLNVAGLSLNVVFDGEIRLG